jgi:translation elongation factor EF-Ts
VADPNEVVTEEVGSAGVIGMVMGVNQMGDFVADAFAFGDFVHRTAEIVADRRRGIEEDDALVGDQEC